MLRRNCEGVNCNSHYQKREKKKIRLKNVIMEINFIVGRTILLALPNKMITPQQICLLLFFFQFMYNSYEIKYTAMAQLAISVLVLFGIFRHSSVFSLTGRNIVVGHKGFF